MSASSKTHTIKASGSTTATTDTTTVTQTNVSGCQGKNTVQTHLEIFHQGAFVVFKQASNPTDPNSLASTYQWLGATFRSGNPKNKVTITYSGTSSNYAWFPDNLKVPVTYYLRVKTWEKWSTHTSNPLYQTQ